MVFRIKQYDTKTALRATLQSDGHPVDLNEAQEVRFILRDYKQITMDKPSIIIDAINGKVWFPFEESETAKKGRFSGEFVVTFLDGRRETFPNEGVIPIEIETSNIALTKSEEG